MIKKRDSDWVIIMAMKRLFQWLDFQDLMRTVPSLKSSAATTQSLPREWHPANRCGFDSVQTAALSTLDFQSPSSQLVSRVPLCSLLWSVYRLFCQYLCNRSPLFCVFCFKFNLTQKIWHKECDGAKNVTAWWVTVFQSQAKLSLLICSY